uniref:Calcineurin-like phosphoesterase domain-containing protein n=1 Tax=Chromera velia CCMP2878 TaxID=1169474 RepID=A0A0G4HM93_9ALVE|eukprot:Cvel_29033.t1-p1 / transcript=Cvel_29033.t1 / gene=Cvel_29033 / organism=Chromera_velia_CCMP2878 / gene_product=UPF0046 protein K07C11.7, putative / transcript_product=UPF0046 protein K07C11.7, putative / location=Cvel_scaffold3912:4614-6002(+) / protein_length=310 / sequence_SO=supercontig / SO=protein_coding / is_pseudo=false
MAQAVYNFCSGLFGSKRYRPGEQEGKTIRVVLISDTHNKHRDLQLPDGDVLIHVGDYTCFGKEEHARDFNAWLGEQKHKVKLVVHGNHESNSPWVKNATEVLSNATKVLKNEVFVTEEGVKIWGTDFFWPVAPGTFNPYFQLIPVDTDILIAHGPAKRFADGAKGCDALTRTCQRVRPALVVSGHIHFAYGHAQGSWMDGLGETLFVNAANADERRGIHPDRVPVVVDIFKPLNPAAPKTEEAQPQSQTDESAQTATAPQVPDQGRFRASSSLVAGAQAVTEAPEGKATGTAEGEADPKAAASTTTEEGF